MMLALILLLAAPGCVPHSASDTTDTSTDGTDTTDTDGVPTTDTSTPTTTTTTPTTPTTDTGPLDPLRDGPWQDSCLRAGEAELLTAGTWRLDTRDFEDRVFRQLCDADHGHDQWAPDALGRIEVGPGELLTATIAGYQHLVTLVRDCASDDLEGSCLATGAPVGPAPARYLNESGATEEVFVVIDGREPWGEPVQLTLALEPAALAELPDTCEDAGASAGIGAGSYLFRLEGAADNVTPTWPGCMDQLGFGPDRVLPIDVPAGQTVTVASDAVVRMVEDCAMAQESCVTGASGGAPARYANRTGGAVQIHAILEAPAGESSLRWVDVSFATSASVVALPESCVEAVAASPLTPGTHTISLQGLTYDHAGSCVDEVHDFYGEAVVPVDVPPRTLVTLEVGDAWHHRVHKRWLSDCSEPLDSCLNVGSSAQSPLAWYNETDTSLRLYAVLRAATAAPADVGLTLTEAALEPVLHDRCDEATAAAPVVDAGVYPVGLSGTNDFEGGSCFFSDGRDGVLPVEVPPETRVVVSTGGPVASSVRLGLLTTCPSAACADRGLEVDHVNVGSTAETVYVVVDSGWDVPVGSERLHVRFEAVQVLPTADACDTEALPWLEPGRFHGTWDGAVADELVGFLGACGQDALWTQDVVVPVDLLAGERLGVELVGNVGTAVLLADCADEDSCLAEAGPALSYAPTEATTGALVLERPLGGHDEDFVIDVTLGPDPGPLPVTDVCNDITGVVGPGRYPFTNVGLEDDLQAVGCGGGLATFGGDGVVPVDVPADTELVFRAIGERFASLYLLEGCSATACDVRSVPVDGRLETEGRWVNDTGATARRYVVVDGTRNDLAFEVELELVPRQALAPADTCADLSSLARLQTGSHAWYGDLAALSDDVPQLTGALGAWLWGGVTGGQDGWVPVRIGPGEAVRATLSQETGAALSLVPDCADPSSLLAHEHWDPSREPPTITWRNWGTEPVDAALLLDAAVQSGPFTLDVVIGD